MLTTTTTGRRVSEALSVVVVVFFFPRVASTPATIPESSAPSMPPSTTEATTTTPSPVGMTYWVSFAKEIRPGTSLAVSVYVANAKGRVTLRLDLMDDDGNLLQDGQNFTLAAKGRFSHKRWCRLLHSKSEGRTVTKQWHRFCSGLGTGKVSRVTKSGIKLTLQAVGRRSKHKKWNSSSPKPQVIGPVKQEGGKDFTLKNTTIRAMKSRET